MTTRRPGIPTAEDRAWVQRQIDETETTEERAMPQQRAQAALLTPKTVLQACGKEFAAQQARLDKLEAEVCELRELLEQRSPTPLRVVGE